MMLLDLPYGVVIKEIKFIIQNEMLIANDNIVGKIVTVLQNVGRAVNAKIHPLKVNLFV